MWDRDTPLSEQGLRGGEQEVGLEWLVFTKGRLMHLLGHRICVEDRGVGIFVSRRKGG